MNNRSPTDVKIANLATGFTLGFGLWTIRNAAKQTKAHRSPKKSIYIYMIWGEIIADSAIALLAWLFLDGVIPPGVPFYFLITFFWVFEIQLLMQIIINRVAVVVDDRDTIRKIKWGTAALMTTINITVFIIWIPSQLEPPPIQIFATINKYWDRISKGIILIVDASLNWYFLVSVRKHIVKEHGLLKYKPLVEFNARLMVVSILMDVMLIVLESLQDHGIVFEAYHPVAYMVKLNIEMTMAALIVKIAQVTADNTNEFWYNTSCGGNPPEYNYNMRSYTPSLGAFNQGLRSITLPDWPIVQPENTYTITAAPNAQADNISFQLGAANQSSSSIKPIRESGADLSTEGVMEITEERLQFGRGAVGRKFNFGQQQPGNTTKISNESIINNEQKKKESGSRADEIGEEDSIGGIVRTREVEIRIEEMIMGKLVEVERKNDEKSK